MKRNQFVFSGIDGCGKSTQIQLLVAYFKSNNIKHKVVWVRPGSTPFILFVKAIARLVFRSLPKPGRSDERETMLKTGNLGRIWFYLTLVDLIYIFKIKVPVLVLFKYKIIFDRHIFDALIDYQIMLDRKLFDNKWVSSLLRTSPRTFKLYLEIPIETSRLRCTQKWEPFPDTDAEKVLRYEIYNTYVDDFDYIKMDGLSEPDSIHKSILKLVNE